MLKIIGFGVVGFILWSIYSGGSTSIDDIAEDFRDTIHSFSNSRSSIKEAYVEAIEAKDAAKIVNFKFKNKKTEEFIIKWKRADSEVKSFRETFIRLNDKAIAFFEAIDERVNSIKDPALKSRMISLAQRKAVKFAHSVSAADDAIRSIEASVDKGNDIISAIEITGVLGMLDGEIAELDNLSSAASGKFADIDKLITEGMNILELEIE